MSEHAHAGAVGAFGYEGAYCDSFWTTWWRRMRSIPIMAGGLIVMTVSLPALLPIAAIVDVVRPSNWSLTRLTVFTWTLLAWDVFGIVASFVAWLFSGVWAGVGRARFDAWNFRLQCFWGSGIFRSALRILSLRFKLDERYRFGRRPFILFIRHVSPADTVLAAHCISSKYGTRLRYVLKRELLWEPCLDIVGQRLRNYFVRRGSEDAQAEVAAVGSLASRLHANEGVLIYPEGTRFTGEKRARILERMKAKGDPLFERAARLKNVLPPKLGGALALLENNHGADAVFCAHRGTEGIVSAWQVLSGGLTGRTLEVKFWGVPFEAIPKGRTARVDWLLEQWARVDAFAGGE